MSYSRFNKRQRIGGTIDNRKSKDPAQRGSIVSHYETSLKKIDEVYENFAFTEYTWKNGDKLYKIAQRFYKDASLWWIIAEINQRPTDFDYLPGDIIKIPNANALEDVVKYLGY